MALISARSGPVLDPIDRVSEVLFGLIMVLTFTGSLSVAESGREDVRAMLVGALGCNLAWGLIDGILYLMARLGEKGGNLATFRAIRGAAEPAHARRLIADALPPLVAGVLQDDELGQLHQRLLRLPEPPPRHNLQWHDWQGAGAVFLLVFLSTFPVAIPFMVMSDTGPALRVSNTIAIALLFLTGYIFGKVSGRQPVWVGCGMVLLGAVLVSLTIALGG
jgi:hypothetical protein